jgi:ribonuclease HI
MIREDNDRQYNKTHIKPLRRTGPLDAYIYKQGADKEDVKEIQDNVVIDNHILTVSKEKKNTIMHVFTDGACPNNGKRNANAAWGALLVTDDGYVVLERLCGAIPLSETQTNQRAELTALLRGLELAEKKLAQDPELKKIQIWSDSQYSINCASVWGLVWKNRGWKKQGGEIQHLDLIRVLVEKTQKLWFKIEYKWLKGHKGGESQHVFPWMFNHQVDALANSALRSSY